MLGGTAAAAAPAVADAVAVALTRVAADAGREAAAIADHPAAVRWAGVGDSPGGLGMLRRRRLQQYRQAFSLSCPSGATGKYITRRGFAQRPTLRAFTQGKGD